jgi:EAL domain-containing protein (putative c-di-GMP-specific phosphodiesterase class I)
MRQAIRGRQLALHYQPKVDLYSGTVVGVEALVRWNHPERGHLSPDQFVPLAEQTDLTSALARWVMEESLTQVEEWRKRELELTMAVNLSAANLHEASLPKYPPQELRARKIGSRMGQPDWSMLRICHVQVRTKSI